MAGKFRIWCPVRFGGLEQWTSLRGLYDQCLRTNALLVLHLHQQLWCGQLTKQVLSVLGHRGLWLQLCLQSEWTVRSEDAMLHLLHGKSSRIVGLDSWWFEIKSQSRSLIDEWVFVFVCLSLCTSEKRNRHRWLENRRREALWADLSRVWREPAHAIFGRQSLVLRWQLLQQDFQTRDQHDHPSGIRALGHSRIGLSTS